MRGLALLLAMGCSLAAQSLSLPEAIRLAGRDSYRAEAARLEHRQALAETGQVHSLYLPELQLDAGHLNLSAQPGLRNGPFTVGPLDLGGVTVPAFSLGPLETPLGDRSAWKAKLSLRYLVYDFGKREAALNAARNREEARGLEGDGQLRCAQAEVAARYVALLGLKARGEVLLQRRKALEDHLQTAQNLFTQGVVARNDLLRTEVALRSLGDAEQALDSAESGAREQLNQALGREPTAPLELKRVPSQPPPLPWNEAQCRERALASNESIRALRAKVKTLEGQTALDRRDWTPNVVAEAFHSYEQNSYSLHPHETGLYMGLSWKVFDGARRSRLQTSAAGLDLARQELRNAEQQAGNAAAEAWRDCRTALREMETARTNVAASEENLRIVEDQYREGMVQGGDALEAEALLAESRFALTEHRTRAYTRQAALLALLGEDLALFYGHADTEEH
nr:TolC family protein [uncultured Holophaga sp.]